MPHGVIHDACNHTCHAKENPIVQTNCKIPLNYQKCDSDKHSTWHMWYHISHTLIFLPFTAFCGLTSMINSHLFYYRLFCKSYFYFSSFRCWDWFQHWTFFTFIYWTNFLISHDIRNYQLCTFIIRIAP